MKKLMVMLAAVAMAASAMADSFITPYSADTNPSNANMSWYSCYFMTVDAITAATGGSVTSVDAGAYATWLQSNFSVNKAATASNASFTMPTYQAWYSSSYGQYSFYYNANLPGKTSFLAVCFFDNQTDSAFQILDILKGSYSVDDSGKSNWTAASSTVNVPEPTSGLMLLLGLAGLALKRKAV